MPLSRLKYKYQQAGRASVRSVAGDKIPQCSDEEGRVSQVANGGLMADQRVGRQALCCPLAQVAVRGSHRGNRKALLVLLEQQPSHLPVVQIALNILPQGVLDHLSTNCTQAGKLWESGRPAAAGLCCRPQRSGRCHDRSATCRSD